MRKTHGELTIDIKKVQQRLADLAASSRAYHDLTTKDKTKVTKGDRTRIQHLEIELKSILAPEERSDLTVDVNNVAKFFGVSDRSIQKWRVRGCPKLKHGLYDLKAVFEWWVDNVGSGHDSKDTENIKLEYWRWKTENERMKAEQTSGVLVPRADIARLWSGRVLEVGTGLFSLANRLPPLLEAKPQREMAAIVKAEIKKLHENYARTGRFCARSDQKQPRNSTKKATKPTRKATK